MVDAKYSTVRLSVDGDKFEILVKPNPALEYKTGKRTDFSSILISEEIYSDANKGSRAISEKLTKHFKTKDTNEIAKEILSRGELALTTDQRRRMVEEKKKQIVQFISRNFVDPRTHIPHPPVRIESAINDVRIVFTRTGGQNQAKQVIEALRKILPLKSEVSVLTITVPAQFSAQSYSIMKTTGGFKNEEWLSDGSLRVVHMTIATSDGESIWIFRYSSEKATSSLYYSTDIAQVRNLYPELDVLDLLGPDTRFIVSEPLRDLPGAWNEVPEGSWGASEGVTTRCSHSSRSVGLP